MVIKICIKYPGGPTRITVTDLCNVLCYVLLLYAVLHCNCIITY
jgi:hypothetical protein